MHWTAVLLHTCTDALYKYTYSQLYYSNAALLPYNTVHMYDWTVLFHYGPGP